MNKSANITNSKGFEVRVAFDVPTGVSRKGVVTGNTITTISGKGSWFGNGTVSDDDLRAFALNIIEALPAPDSKPTKNVDKVVEGNV